MKENSDDKLSHFSYYNVLVRNRVISSAIAQSQGLQDTLFTQIKAGKFTAQEMREHLPTVIAKPKILRKFEKGDVTLDDAFDRAKISGIEQRLKKIRDGLDDIEKSDINGLERNDLNTLQQVVKHIRQRLNRVSGMIDKTIATQD